MELEMKFSNFFLQMYSQKQVWIILLFRFHFLLSMFLRNENILFLYLLEFAYD